MVIRAASCLPGSMDVALSHRQYAAVIICIAAPMATSATHRLEPVSSKTILCHGLAKVHLLGLFSEVKIATLSPPLLVTIT